MATTPTRVRLRDFLLNPEIDDQRLELIDGAVTEKSMPTFDHGELAVELAVALRQFGRVSVEARAVITEAGASPLPDVAFYRHGGPSRGAYMTTPPTVAIEIRSDGQSLAFMRRKAALYLSFGVESVWLVDPDREELRILENGTERLLGAGDRITSTAVPGLDVALTDVYRPLNQQPD